MQAKWWYGFSSFFLGVSAFAFAFALAVLTLSFFFSALANFVQRFPGLRRGLFFPTSSGREPILFPNPLTHRVLAPLVLRHAADVHGARLAEVLVAAEALDDGPSWASSRGRLLYDGSPSS